MQYVSTRRRLVEQAVQQFPEGPWQFDFILTPEEFSRLYGVAPAAMQPGFHLKKPAFPVLILSLILLAVLALASPRVFRRIFKHAHHTMSHLRL